MAEASQAAEPSMEEILASIRRIISDEDADAGEQTNGSDAVATNDNPDGSEADMSDATELSQDDLDKLFDMDEIAGDDGGDDVDDMAAAMEEDAMEDEAGFPDEEPEDDVLELTGDLELTEDLELSEDDMSDGGEMELVEGLAEDLDSDSADIGFAAAEEEEFPEEEDEPDFEMEAAAAPEPDPFEEEEMPVAAAPAPAPIPAATIATKPVPASDLPNVEDDGPLISNESGAAIHSALDNLSAMFVGSKAQTVEELIQEMLRPMLKAWLDQNLPGMVEQMVQKEIKRITRGR